ncbi:replication initiation protein [Burkholderia cenocepacia]|uniref:replication initiation protein n=1 Tax=Burkholderia cenocepacia TaxID=95486 RepID=UPI0007619DB6|nr:replication initiation protein [Burkholderia cenocepacia]KWU23343.1 hypothetical protein AS149_37355 [Burkholderia cenocepacia]
MSDGIELSRSAQQEQLALVMDYPPVKDVPTLRKPVPVVHIYPVNGEYDLYTRRVFNVLLVETYKTWSTMSPEMQAQYLAERRVLRFRSMVSNIRKQLGNASKSNRRVVQAVRKLYQLEFRFDVMGDDGDLWNMDSRLLFQVGRRKNAVTVDGVSVPAVVEEEDEELVKEICWEFPPDVFDMLMSRRVYAAIDLSLSNSWKSQFTLSLYENTYRYRNNPTKLTARLSVEQWMNLLANGSPALERYKRDSGYRYFKREMLKPAIDELNSSEVCPITVEPLEGWSGRRITTLQFRIIEKDLSKTSGLARELAAHQPAENPEMAKRLKGYGLADDVIKRLLGGSPEDLVQACDYTDAKLRQGGVRDPAAYFMKALAGRFKETESAEAAATRQQKAKEASLKASASRDEVELAFKKHRGARTRAYYGSQAPVTQSALVTAFLAAEESAPVRDLYHSKGMDNARVSGSFFNWLAGQQGILTQPEELSEDAFQEWREAQAASKRKGRSGS